MKKHLVLLSVLLLQAAAVSVFAQDKPNTGDIIAGAVVTDSDVPMAMVHIMELDSVHDFFVTDTRTDSTGRFSFSLVKPGDRLCIHKEGFETVILPITNTYHEIKLKAQPQTVDLSEFDGLEETIYDYVLQSPRPLQTVANESVQDNMQHEYVDLGLSVKWATCNVGASKPEEAGCHYAWGELEEKDNYIVENYKFYESDDYHHINKYNGNSFDGFIDDKMILDPEDDVAHVKWGGKWRMPTAEEWEELIEDCAWEWVEVNGMGGYRITGKKPGYKDRSIFLPASGSYLRMENEFDLFGNRGDYWSSSRSTENYYRPASGFFIDRFECKKSVTSRHLPKSVRPVCPK